MTYKSIKASYDEAIALLVPESATFEADKAKLDKELAILISQQGYALKKAVSDAESLMLRGKREDIAINAEKYHSAKDALLLWEQEQQTPEQVAAQLAYDEALSEKEAIDVKFKDAMENLKKLFPQSPAIKKERAERTSTATVHMTVALKEEVLRLKRAGKRNIEIAEITGLNNGQISPILQKAGVD